MPIISNLAGLVKPDVYLQEQEPPVQVLGKGTGVIGFVGQFSRGELNTPTIVSDPADLIRKFGEFTSGLDGFMTAIQSMNQGATQIKVVRIADDGCTEATGSVSGGSTALFTEEALSPGTWGNSISRRITNSTTSGFMDIQYTFGNEVASYVGVNFDSTSDRYLIDIINQDPNRLVNVTRVAAAGVTTLPSSGTVSLSGGSDGTNTGDDLDDSYYVGTDAASGKSGIVAFEADDEVNIVFSERSTSTINTALIAHAAKAEAGSISPRMVIIAPAFGTSIDSLKTTMADINSDYVVMTYPWLQVYNANNKTKEYMNPTSFLAGLLSTLSPHVSPSRKQIAGLIGVERRLTRAEMVSLINYRVLTINPENGLGYVCNSGITTSSNGGKRQIVRRRMVNYLSTALERGLQPFVSQPHTQALQQAVKTAINGFLEREVREGRVGKSDGGKAYAVKCDSSNNPPAVVQANRLIVEVAVSLLAPADIIIVKLDASEENTRVSAS
jgi:phage tail sheath protein FI